MQKKWQIAPKISDDISKKFPEISPVILQLLFNRNLTNQTQIDEFLNPDYSQDIHDSFLFNDMAKAVARIKKAINENKKIVIHGDYDADGVSATAILLNTLKKIGAKNIDIYLPHREKEGYGLNSETIEYFRKEKVNLIITCDCGISNHLEISQAKEYGIETIITDHHHEPEKMPTDAYAIINPSLSGEKYPFKFLAGAGVAFKVAQALIKDFKLDESGWDKWLLDLVAIGTVADVSAIIGENRTLVKYGLVVLKKTKRLGLQKLFAVSGLKIEKLNTHSIGYQLGPRINSAGRIDHANSAFKLLVTENIEEAIVIANNLNKNNQERQKQTDQVTSEARNLIKEDIDKEKMLIAAKAGWNPGIIGLVAGKICQEFHRPTFIFAFDGEIYQGSGRSIPEFNIIEAVQTQDDLLERYGGHAGACGLSVKKENFEKVCQNLKKLAKKELKNAELKPTLLIDTEIGLNDLNWDVAEELEKFEPFGETNPRPKFLTANLTVNDINLVGTDGQHMKIKVADDSGQIKKAIIFNCENICPNLVVGEKIDLVYEITVNVWNGTKEIELSVNDLRLSKK